jgi:hypothetical protein
MNRLMGVHEKRLDIIYNDNLEFDQYSNYIFWNGTIIEP